MSQYDAIPAHMMSGIQRYVSHGAPPGDFLTAIICNDLKKAVEHADDTNMTLIHLYVKYFYNRTPAPCWGSRDKMDAWVAAIEVARREAFDSLPDDYEVG